MVNYVRIYFSEGDTLGVRFFTAFCNHWHCTFAMVLSLLCNHWQFLLGFLQWLNKTKIKKNSKPRNQKAKKQKKTRKTQKKNDKTQLSATTPPLGVCNLVFFWFVVFLFFWFLGFWFVVGLSAMAKQNQNPKKQETKRPKKQTTPKKMARPNSLPLLPPWGVQSRFLFFFVYLFFWFLVFLVFWFLGFLFSGSLLVFWRVGRTTQKWRT